MKVLSFFVLGVICLYSVAGEEHLFKSETHVESGFLFNRIERDSESLNNNQGLKGVFLAGFREPATNNPRKNPKSVSSSATQSSKDQRGDRSAQAGTSNS